MHRKQLFRKVVILIIILGLFIIGFLYSKHDKQQKFEQKIALQDQQLPKVKPAFESELTLILPESIRIKQAPYGDVFSVRHLQTLGHNQDFDGYSFSRVFRVNKLSAEEIKSQIRSQLEKNGYIVDAESLAVSSTPRDFKVGIELLPFEYQGFTDVKVDLYRKY